MPKLYTLKNGKIGRKDHNGRQVILKSGQPFVPSPSEFSAERHRLADTGKVVDWTSDEAKAAIQNTNQLEYPTFGKPGAKPVAQEISEKVMPSPVAVPPTIEDIRTVSVKIGVEAIKSANDVALLNTYRQQEENNEGLYTRNSIIRAIDTRIAELVPSKQVSAASADMATTE